MKRKLKFECLPQALWGKNIRSELGQDEWDIIRKKTYKKYNHRCAICGKRAKMNAHEVWKLKINSKKGVGTQILVNVISVCDDCHNTIHIGRSLAIGIPLVKIFYYYKNVNNVSHDEAIADLRYMDEKLDKLNRIQYWDIDLSLLKNDEYLKVFDIV